MTDFPDTPLVGDEFVVAGTTYVWNGYGWTIKPIESGGGTGVDAYTKTESDAKYVKIPGDIMTGSLTVHSSWPTLYLNKPDDSNASVVGRRNDLTRWGLTLGDLVPETGGNTGSNFVLARYDDAGAGIDAPLAVDRATGAVSVPAAPTLGQHVANKTYVDTLVVGKLDVFAADLRYVKVEMFEDLIKTLMARIEALEAR